MALYMTLEVRNWNLRTGHADHSGVKIFASGQREWGFASSHMGVDPLPSCSAF